jgi:Protein of unknown function (DUF1553)/Protein of unknown function (DUF1549)/Planctomycete cytochrome C
MVACCDFCDGTKRPDRRWAGALLVCILVFSAWWIDVRPAIAASPQTTSKDTVDFQKDIYPIFSRSCLECHGTKVQEAGLRLDVKEAFLDIGVVEIGKPEESELIRRITLPRGHEGVMPMVGEPLSGREVDTIRRWIRQGVPWRDDFTPPPHWAYVAPTRPALPEIQDPSWPKTPLDYFVLSNLEDRSMRPSASAAPTTLLRRVYLDLIGLPPTPREIEVFIADPSPDAYSRVVDDLLDRPQFGERWARHWLDLARYADSHGFQRDNLHDLWAYRDWVIDAMNKDMPYDQFTIQQLAGDLLPEASQSQRIATGFHRCSPINVEAGAIPEETRIEQVMDRVNTTATVWLGSTLECAQCHDHKYDPFTTNDYYRFLAFFNSTELEADRSDPKSASSISFQGPTMELSDPEKDDARNRLNSQIARLESAQQGARAEIEKNLNELASNLARENGGVSESQPSLAIEAFESQGTTDSYEIREDGSVLLVGNDPPSKDVYTITANIQGRDIRYIRLDALTDESLQGKGPGRGDPIRTNFVLNDFSASIIQEGKSIPLRFIKAKASFSQNAWDVGGAIDDSPKSGWAIAPQFGKPHWATFELSDSMDASQGIKVRFELSQQFGQARTIGCLRLTAMSEDTDREVVPKRIAALAKREPKTWTKEQRSLMVDHFVKDDGEFQKLSDQIGDLRKEFSRIQAPSTLVMVELDQPRPSNVLMRGDYRSLGPSVTPGTPSWLHKFDLHTSESNTLNRLTLARWLVDPANPLVARTAVNRWWAEIFGEGFVRTPEDFGIKGDRPSHPQLLDWLAVELIENGWSMKHILKTIVLSSTYQQSSVLTPELAQWDDQNRWLARGPSQRMGAEMIRDNALAISGLLSLKQFGPPIRPYQPDGIWSKVGGTKYDYEISAGSEAYRRGIYVVIKRGSPYPSFINFDANNRFSCTVSRSRSNTPLQALTLLNDRVYVESASAIALRAMKASMQQSVESTIEQEFLQATSRRPEASELQKLSKLHRDQRSAADKDPRQAKQLLPDQKAPFLRAMPDGDKLAVLAKQENASEFSAWYSVATVLLNLHETITKE